MSCDYPDFAHALGNGIANGDVYPGIGICGSGEGMAITLNKHKGVRAALVWNPEIAQLTRQHNDANILCFGAGVVGHTTAAECVKIWLETEVMGGNHPLRLEMIRQLEEKYAK